MNDRIKIINSFRSNFGERKKSISNRLSFLYFLVVFILIIIFCSTYSALSSLFNFNLLINFNWSNAGYSIMGALAFIIMIPTILFEIQLLKHLKSLEMEESKNNTELLNKDFQKKINDLNKNSASKIIMIVLTIIMLIGSLINSDEKGDFLYWNNFIIPYFLLILIIAIQIINGYNNLNQNIKEYEEQ